MNNDLQEISRGLNGCEVHHKNLIINALSGNVAIASQNGGKIKKLLGYSDRWRGVSAIEKQPITANNNPKNFAVGGAKNGGFGELGGVNECIRRGETVGSGCGPTCEGAGGLIALAWRICQFL